MKSRSRQLRDRAVDLPALGIALGVVCRPATAAGSVADKDRKLRADLKSSADHPQQRLTLSGRSGVRPLAFAKPILRAAKQGDADKSADLQLVSTDGN